MIQRLYFAFLLFVLAIANSGQAQCENYTIQIFSDVAESGPTSVTWILETADAQFITQGTATFAPFVFLNSTNVCLESGQYVLTITSAVPLLSGAFLAGVQQGSTNIFPTNEVAFGNTMFVYEFDTDPLSFACSASFTWEETSTPGLIQFNSTSTSDGNGITYGWEFAGDTQPAPMNPTYQYATNGTYNVCLNIVATLDGQVGCINTQCENIEVSGFTNGEICPGNISITTLDEGCGHYHLAVQNAELDAEIAWFPTGSGGSAIVGNEIDFYYEAPGLYELCVAYVSTLCPSGTQICEEFVVANCSDCPSELVIIQSECPQVVLQFGAENTPTTDVHYDWDDGVETNGGVAQTHTYDELNAIYNVCATYTNAYCTEGVTECVEIDFSECVDTSCPNDIVIEDISCIEKELYVLNGSKDATYAWASVGNESSDPAFTLISTTNETFEVTLTYTSGSCPDGVVLETTVAFSENCFAGCPESIDVVQTDCNAYSFSLISEVELIGSVAWYVNDQFTAFDSEFDYTLSEAGEYIISAYYEGDDCVLGAELFTTVIYQECTCPTEIVVSNTGCFLFTLSTDNGLANADYEWSINTSSFTTPTVNYTIAFPFTANIELVYTGFNCPQGVTLNAVLNYNTCGSVCPGAITAEQIECNLYELSFANVTPNMEVLWTIDGENFSGSEINYTLPEEGNYLITAVVTNPSCPNAITLTKELVWDDCAALCPTSVVATNLGCNVYSLTTPTIEAGSTSTWEIDGDEYIGSTVYYTLSDQNDVPVELNYVGDQCSFGVDLNATLVYTPCSVGCPEEIVAIQLGCNTYQFSLDVSEPEAITWNINGIEYVGNNIGFVLQGSESLEVNATYGGSDCIDGSTLNLIFAFEPCGIACPSTIIVENLCNDYHFSIDAGFPQLGAIWTVNGQIVGTETELSYTLSEAGAYEIEVTYSGPDCPLGTTLSETFEYQQCNTVCPTEIVVTNTGCNSYYLSLNNVASSEMAIWTVNGQALPAINGITTVVTEVGLQIEVYYEGTECTNGITLETELVWDICGDGSCDAIFSYFQGIDGEVNLVNNSPFTGAVEFEWTYENGSTSEESPTLQFPENGQSEVCLTVSTPTCVVTNCQTIEITSYLDCDINEDQNEVFISLTADLLPSSEQAGTITFFLEKEIALTLNFNLDDIENTITQSFCLPFGCYSVVVQSAVPFMANEVEFNVIDAEINQVIGNATLDELITDVEIPLVNYLGCPDNVNEIGDNIQLHVYPNPTSDFFILASNEELIGTSISITDLTGRMVLTQLITSAKTRISIDQLSPSIYTLHSYYNGEINSVKLQVMGK